MGKTKRNGADGAEAPLLNSINADYDAVDVSSTDPEKTPPKVEEAAEKEKKPTVSIFQVFRFADGADTLMMIIGTIAAFIGGAGMPAFSLTFGRLLNGLNTGNLEHATANAALVMVYVGLVVFGLQATQVTCWTIAASRQAARVRLLLFQSVLRQEIGWHDEHKPGELTSRMSGDTRVFQNGINDKLSNGIVNASMGISGFLVGFLMSWELTLVMIGLLPVTLATASVMGNLSMKKTMEARKAFSDAGAVSTEVMENIRTVQTFGQEEYEVGRFHQAILIAEKAGIKKEVFSALTAGSMMSTIFVSYTVSFFFASYLVRWGRADVGTIFAAFMAVGHGNFALGFMAPAITAFTDSRAAAYELFKIIDRVPSIDIDAPGVPMTGFSKSIEFKNVRFAYPTRPDMELFKDLCLTIKKGQKVAFSGASGCGKSSIIGLLQRFYDPLGGEVLVDGQDMRTLSLRDLRNNIGIVSQEPNLFMGSMAENVRVGKPDATLDEVMEACKQANIHDTIMGLPDQYDTPVGAVGSQLSGGQKQRISIARAIIKKPPILLLDEATSALDRHSEVEVQKSLDDLMKGGMTVVIVAHRLTTIRNVDCIYYVSHDDVRGSVIEESGTFDELVALQGHFAAMAKTQGAVSSTGAVVATDNQKAIEAEASQFLDDVEVEKLYEKEHRTTRQRVPFQHLAKWEVRNTNVGMFRIMKMNKDHVWAIVLGVLSSAISGAVAPIDSILFGKVLAVLARYSIDHDLEELKRGTNLWAPSFIPMGILAFMGFTGQCFYGYAGERLTTKIRTMLYRQILRQDQSFFDIPGRDAGTLAGMLSGDCEAVHQLWGPSIGYKVQTACAIGAGLIIGFCYQWKLACLALACLPVVAVCSLFQFMLIMGATQKKEGENDDTIFTEALSNVRTVAAFNMQPERVAAFRAVVKKEAPRDCIKGAIIGFAYGVSQFVFFGAFAYCFYVGGILVKRGEATFETVVITSMAVLMGGMHTGEAGGFISKIADADKASKRVFSVIDRVPDVDVYERKDTDLGGSGCDIKLHHVRFIYPARPKQVVLQSVDLRFEDGTSNGLMGQTGCGKSTIIQMLARFYDNRGGAVMVNGKNITDLDIETWRKNISIVLQEPNLFSGTVRDNIRYARGDATEEEIIEVAKLAQIHDDIVKMPEGYDTDVGYKGRALSGGQKQRVAIARGLLRRPKLLLLDEATSALDNVTESRVQEGIDDYQRKYNVTTVAIAHRLTTIRNCDQIVLLDTGRILEQGSHDELMALNGEYKSRWELYAGALQ